MVVKVKAATLNYKDLVLALGWLPLNNGDADYVPLSDGAGKVVGVGPGVRNLQPGDRVVPSFFRIGKRASRRATRSRLDVN